MHRWHIALLILAAACQRVEEPQSSPPAQSGTAPAVVPDPSSTATARCVVATAPEAAPSAQPAQICPTAPDQPPALARATVAFPDAPGRPTVNVELARTEPDRTRGLMYRTSMAQDDGMLFIWKDERIRSFWMRNTCLPLDMLFIAADGFIVGVLEQIPTLNEASRSVPCPAAHVLEVNAGWTRQHGVKAGQRVELP
jgi:hypothetical protein